uniref:Ribosomal RNA-processing protein 42 n=1 Tax=Rhodosorus marinus TaxID=101924 RepID=A0A7S0BLU9_9RHOD|mmetsp:Transcript_22681/g.32649  ORF Transcript_22681/g.32649 Transcript_22681/m.32649 type:complete len:284 (+) Transcript_22681:100-951(+)
MRISCTEVDYIALGASSDFRADGRQAFEFRDVVVESHVVPSVSGSCRAQVGGTDVLVYVKAELDEAQGKTGTEGVITITAHYSSVAGLDNEIRTSNILNAELQESLNRLFSEKHAANLERLCLLEGRVAWTVLVDVTVLKVDGNVLDVASFAVRNALLTTLVPYVDVIRGEEGEVDEIEVDDEPASRRLLLEGDPPVYISLYLLGSKWILDASQDEEASMTSKLSVGVNSRGKVCGVIKAGEGALEWDGLGDTLKTATRMGVKIIEGLRKLQFPRAETVGFFA